MAKLDRNGYSKSIMPTEDGVCYLCGTRVADTVRHEIYPGKANRRISKENGFWINLCVRHHQLVHKDEEYAVRALKKPCQDLYLETHSREEFRKLIGRFYE